MKLFLLLVACLAVGCRSSQTGYKRSPSKEEVLTAAANLKPPAVPDPYAPELHAIEKLPLSDKLETVYWFSDAQLERLARSPLDRQRFIAYVKRVWPIGRLREYCVRRNRWAPEYQNLVALNSPFGDVDLYIGDRHGFDRIWVYVSEDLGKGKYFGSTGWNWHRWTYSLNVSRKDDHWVIIEHLPNDFMDSPKYTPDDQ